MQHVDAQPRVWHPCAQSVSVSGCAGATGSLWDALHASAVEAVRPVTGDHADSAGCAPMSQSQSQSDMDLDSPFASPTAKGAALASTVVRWSHGAGTAVQHPPQHALTTLSAVRCTSMRTCRIGLARSADPALEGALLPASLRFRLAMYPQVLRRAAGIAAVPISCVITLLTACKMLHQPHASHMLLPCA